MVNLSTRFGLILVVGGLASAAAPAVVSAVEEKGQETPRVTAGSGDGGFGPLIPLQIGARWEYAMLVWVFPSELVRDEDGAVSAPEPKRMDGRRVMELEGFAPFGGSDKPLARFVTRMNGEVVNEEFSEVTRDVIRSFGGRSLIRESGDWKERVLDPALQTLQADLRRGAHWFGQSVISGDLVIRRRFDVLGKEPVKVAAGDFDAIKLRFVGNDSDGAMIKRYIWYVRGIGVVQTHTIHYGKGLVTMVESEELVQFTPGTGDAGSRASGGTERGGPLKIP